MSSARRRLLTHAPAAGQQVDDLACLNTHECVTVDTLGNAVRFNPVHRGSGHAVQIDPGETLTAVACAGGRCTAGDRDGRVLTGVPGAKTWSVTTLRLAGLITSISCPDSRACVVADDLGHLYWTATR
jgi:hypothetical protein